MTLLRKFLLKKINKFAFNYHRHVVQPLSFVYFVALFLKTPVLKNFPLKEDTPPYGGGGVLFPHVQRLCIILLLLFTLAKKSLRTKAM